MENKKNKRKIFKRLGAIVCAVAVAIVAFVVPFSAKFSPEINPNNLVAKADGEVVTTFEGSSLFFPLTYKKLESGYHDSYSYTVFFGRFYLNFNSSGFQWHYFAINPGEPNIYFSLVGPRLGYGSTITWEEYYDLNGNLITSAPAFTFKYSSSSSFDFTKILSVDIGGYMSAGNPWNYIRYNDSNGYSVQVDLKVWTSASSSSSEFSYFVLPSRSYVLGSTLNSDDSYNMGYTAGQSAGYSNGYTAGQSSGYSEGYSAGDTIGYNRGYSAGVEVGNDYTFFSLVSAVIDAPIQAFMGLFNFELLGINLAGFFTGLLTLAFIITIVRLVMP